MLSYLSKPRTPKAPKVLKVGPAVSRGNLDRPSTRDTWRMIRLLAYSLIATPKHKKQLPHTPDARSDESAQDLGPAAASGKFRTVRFEGHGTRLNHFGVSLIAISRSKDQPFHIRERRKHLGGKHRVIARGHLGDKESCAGGAKGAKFSYRGDHRDLQAPSDPISILFLAWSK
jgi:hypothetical protein